MIDSFYIDEIIKEAVTRVFDIVEWGKVDADGPWVFVGKFQGNPEDGIELLNEIFRPLKLMVAVRRTKDGLYKIIISKAPPVPRQNIWVNVLLFFLTLLSTFFVGSFMVLTHTPHNLGQFLLGYKFAVPLLLILGIHELGHYYLARKHGVYSTLPYFIPFPLNMVGTLGAFIKLQSPIPSRKALLDIGIAGPIAGLIVAIPVTIIGLMHSIVVPLSSLTGNASPIEFGEPLLFLGLRYIILGAESFKDSAVLLTPTAFAGWVGFFVTSLNLLPVGQLDGGHILYAVFGKKHLTISRIVVLILIILGVKWVGWLIWAILLIVLGISHPEPLDEVTPLDGKRKALAALALVMLILTFVPVPIKVVQ